MNTEKAKLVLNNLVQITFPELKSLFSSIYGGSAIAILKEYGTPKKLAKAHISKVSLCCMVVADALLPILLKPQSIL